MKINLAETTTRPSTARDAHLHVRITVSKSKQWHLAAKASNLELTAWMEKHLDAALTQRPSPISNIKETGEDFAFIQIRVPEEKKQKWKEAAAQAARTLSGWVKHHLDIVAAAQVRE